MAAAEREPSTGTTSPNASQSNTRLDWALKYSELGFCIIPVHYRSKNAAIEWKSYQNRMSTEQEIRSWFTNKDYNVAIVLGKISCALEIDIDGEGGKKRFEKLFQQFTPNLQSAIKNTMRVVSSNGLKLIFKFRLDEWHEGIKTAKLWKAPDGDHNAIELRANSSYSLGVSSVHPDGLVYSLAVGSEFIPFTLLKSEIEELVEKISDVQEFENDIHIDEDNYDQNYEIITLEPLDGSMLNELANNAKKYYKGGSKNDFTLGFASCLRKLGVRYDDVYKILYLIDSADAKNLNRLKYIFKHNPKRLAGKKYLIGVLKNEGHGSLIILKTLSELFGPIEQLKKQNDNGEKNTQSENRDGKDNTADDDLEDKFRIIERKSPADILYDLARVTILEQFQDNDTGESYAVYKVNEHKEVHSMESVEFEYFLRRLFEQDYERQQAEYFKAKEEAAKRKQVFEFLNDCKEIGLKIHPHGKIIGKEHLLNAVQQLKVNVSEKKRLYLRSFYENGILRYDLTDDKWRYVEIDRNNGVRICQDSYRYFKRYDNSSSGSRTQVEPVIITDSNREGNKRFFDNLIDSFNILSESSNDKILLFKVYWIALYFSTNPKFPMPIPAVSGPHDSAKSTLLTTVKYHVDPVGSIPSLLDKWGRVDDQKRRGLIVSRNFLTYFDNMSHLSNEESDELCLYATGSEYQERKLFSNTEIVRYLLQANIGYNGINDLARNPDLLSRVIPFELEKLKHKIPFTLYWKQRELERPFILGYLFDVIKRVIPRYEKEVLYSNSIKTTHRLADFIILGEIIAQELGERPGRFLEIFQNVVADEQNTKAIENNSFAQILIEYILSRGYRDADGKPITKWHTTTTSLYAELVSFAKAKNYNITGDWDFPHDPVGLGKKLTRLRSTLISMGIKIERKKDRANTKWIIEINNNASEDKIISKEKEREFARAA